MRKYLTFLLLTAIFGGVFAQKDMSIIVATYNLRLNTLTDKENAWPFRKENVKALIQFHDFDIFGTQEGHYDQLMDLLELQGYSYTGVGRSDGKRGDEHSAIFYKTTRFKLLDSGDFWLSETPDKPSKGWDATCCNRICSWAKFEDLQTKIIFFFFNVHFDHEGKVARRESANLILQRIRNIAEDYPVICVGDFNADPDDEPIQIMQTALSDAKTISQTPPYGPDGTFNNFNYNASLEEKDRVDYLFVDDKIDVLKYGVLSDAKNQAFFSDHLPVMAKIVFKKSYK